MEVTRRGRGGWLAACAVACGVVLIAGRAQGAMPAQEPLGVATGRPSFSAQVSLRMAGRDSMTATVYATVSGSDLAFVRGGGHFQARCEASVTVRRTSAKALFTVTDTLLASAPSYEATKSDSVQLTWRRDIAVRPGDYLLDITMRDLEAGEKAKVRLPLSVENLRAHDGTLSPLVLGRLKAGVDSAQTLDDIESSAARTFGQDHPLTVIGGEIYTGLSAADSARAARDSTWTLGYQIVDGDGTVRLRGRRTVPRHGDSTPFVLQPPLDWLALGQYALTVWTMPDGPMREVRFDVDETLLDFSRDLKRISAMISYVATHADLDSLRLAPSAAERKARWDRFWQRREDTGSRNRFFITRREYFRRLRAADEMFRGSEGGWRSDRGRIFIKFGPPEQTEEQPLTGYDPAIQTWRYYSPNRIFRFADKDGFGRWILVASSGGE